MTSNGALRNNKQHCFAQNSSLNIYNSNSIYTYIPKNACSTMRASIAYANGCISNPQNFNWIHQNNSTFLASLSDLVKADYTFVILRCPYARLASVFLDKIVAKYPPAWIFYNQINRKIELDDITFTSFVDQLSREPILKGNEHWRPQIDFLVYHEYDDYFCLENFSRTIKVLKEKIDLDIIDVRTLTNHGIDKLEILDNSDFSNTKAIDIYNLKMNGKCPSPKSLYSNKLIEKVKNIYREDILLYKEKFNQNNLMFNYSISNPSLNHTKYNLN